jgi:Protein of unknown function (DUF2599)
MLGRLSLAVLALTLTLVGCSTAGSDSATVVASPSVSTSAPASRLVVRGPLVATSRWEQEPAGFRLYVQPTGYGRRHAHQAPRRTFDEALTSAGKAPLKLSASTRQSLFNQLRCHTVFARRKPTWNLETWRPDVGYLKTVLAQCNP